MKAINTFLFVFIGSAIFLLTACGPKYSLEEKETYTQVLNKGGQTLGFAPASGVTLIVKNAYAFKDLNKNGELDNYEDWRLPVDERARDLVSQMSVEQMAGLMLYSAHQSIPSRGRGFGGGATYNEKSFDESGAEASDLSDQQRKFLTEDHLRHVLITSVSSPIDAAKWNNNAQVLVEGLGLGIPVNTSSDPRHRTRASAEFDYGSGGDIRFY
jgi:beta-glucosidase